MGRDSGEDLERPDELAGSAAEGANPPPAESDRSAAARLAQLPSEAVQLAQRAAATLLTTSVEVVQETETLLAETSVVAVSVATAPVRSVLGDLRAVSGYTAHRILSAAKQRLTVYHPREAEIASTAQSMAAAGKSEEEIARWAVAARNRLRHELRSQGDVLVDSVAALLRRDHDMPTYEQLRESGKSDAEIIASAARSNSSVDALAVVATEAAPTVDAGLAVLDELIVRTAPAVEQPELVAQAGERAADAISGGQAGEAAGAALIEELGAALPGSGVKLMVGIASVIGGIDGAIQGGREKDEGAG